MSPRKYNLFVVVVGVIALSLAKLSHAEVGQSQLNLEKKYNISTDPLSLVLGLANLGFDFKVSPTSNLGIQGAFSSYSVSDHSYTMYGGGVRLDHYLTGEALSDSWYVAPYARVLPVRSSSLDSNSIVPFSFGALMGYQWLYKDGFNMKLGLGVQYAHSNRNEFSAVLPAAEFKLGYAF